MKIIKAKDIQTKNSTYLIYASPGTGKTTALKFLAGQTLVIDIDKSSAVLKGCENIDIAEIDTHNAFKEWLAITKELLTTDIIKDYDNLVIDNISELFRSCLANLGREGKNNRVPSQSDYQRLDFTLLDSLRALQSLPVKLVLTAWETSDLWTEENGQQFNRAIPDIRPKILNNFLGLIDVVARLTTKKDEEGEVIRGFILEGSRSVYAKNRLDDRKGCKVDELWN